MATRHLFIAAMIVATLGLPAASWAQETPQATCGEDEVCWKPEWRKMRTWEKVVASSLAAGRVVGHFVQPQPGPTWKDDSGWDLALSEAIEITDPTAHKVAVTYADVTFRLAMLYPVIDAVLVAGLVHRDWEVAGQMVWFDFEAFALVTSSLWVTQAFIGRERPGFRRCDDPGRIGHSCEPDSKERFRSFYSGHAAIVMTTAATRCVHHAELPLYGGGVFDRLSCWGMLALGVGSAISRGMTGAHYPSDILVGAAIGLGAGYLLPRALHYGFSDSDVEVALVPWSGPDGTGTSFVAWF